MDSQSEHWVDSMGTHSFASPALAQALRTEIIPTSVTLQLGAKSSRVPRVGKAHPIEDVETQVWFGYKSKTIRCTDCPNERILFHIQMQTILIL
jgi:hypothetical protein